MAADAATFPPVWDAEGRWAAIVSPDNRLKACGAHFDRRLQGAGSGCGLTWRALELGDARAGQVWDVGSGLVKFEYVPPNHLTRRVTAVGWVHLPRPAGEVRARPQRHADWASRVR